MDPTISSSLIQRGWHSQNVSFLWGSQLSKSVKSCSFITHSPVHSFTENNKDTAVYSAKLKKKKKQHFFWHLESFHLFQKNLYKRKDVLLSLVLLLKNTEIKLTRPSFFLDSPFPSERVSNDLEKHMYPR